MESDHAYHPGRVFWNWAMNRFNAMQSIAEGCSLQQQKIVHCGIEILAGTAVQGSGFLHDNDKYVLFSNKYDEYKVALPTILRDFGVAIPEGLDKLCKTGDVNYEKENKVNPTTRTGWASYLKLRKNFTATLAHWNTIRKSLRKQVSKGGGEGCRESCSCWRRRPCEETEGQEGETPSTLRARVRVRPRRTTRHSAQ